MADAKIVDIKGVQWELKDEVARNKIAEVESKVSEIMNITLGGTFSFLAKMKYLGEDAEYKYYNFWWEPQNKQYEGTLGAIVVVPPNTAKDKILNININAHQKDNDQIYKGTQHSASINQSGMATYLFNVFDNVSWTFSGMGILRRTK